MRHSIRHRGIALITAMLVMALAAIAAAAVLGSANTAIRRSATLIDGERAWWYATGVESWVRSILARDRRDTQLDGLGEDWARPVDFLPVEQGGLSGGLEDLQGRFNLNNLAAPPPKAAVYIKQWQRLFRVLDLDAAQALPLAAAIRDWIDPNALPESGGGEDPDYQGLEQPYRAANQAMRSPSELLAVKGMNRDIFLRLAPFVTALPLDNQTPTPVNVNTASKEVLMALSDSTDASRIDAWLQKRLKDPVDNPQKLQADQTLPADVTADLVSARSEYFQLNVTAFIGSGQVHLYSVLRRPASGPPLVIARSLGTE